MGTVSNRPWEGERGEGTGGREGRESEGERGGDRRERGEETRGREGRDQVGGKRGEGTGGRGERGGGREKESVHINIQCGDNSLVAW